MNSLKPMFLVGSLLLSPLVWAEGGSDRLFERMQQLNDKAPVLLAQAQKAPADERQVSVKEHMSKLVGIMGQLHKERPASDMPAQDHQAWMEKHDKAMDDVLMQMAREHERMMADK